MSGALRRKFALWGAKLEAYLSTHAFEILFITMFVVANVLQFIWGAHDEFHHVRKLHPDKPAFKWYIAIARGAGYTLNFNCAIIIILASRIFVTSIRETPLHKVLPLDKSFPLAHIIVGYAILLGVVIHVPFHFMWLIIFDQFDPFKLWSFSMSVAFGIPLMVIFFGMFATAIPWMRRKFFRLFYVIHLVGAFLFFVLLIFHGMYRQVPETFKWIAPAMILYAIDRIIRRLKISTSTLALSREHSTIKPGRVLELRVPKPFNYRAGQYAEIAVPSLGKEWHPFTIASAPHEPTMCFYIKANGDWTNGLYEAFERREADDTIEPIAVRVRGPFGAPAQHTGSYKRVVLISGGIGATPFAAISKHLHHRAAKDIDSHFPRKHTEAYDEEYQGAGNKLRYRVSKAIGNMYDLSADGKPLASVLKEQRAKYVSDTLKLSSVNGALSSKLPRDSAVTAIDTGLSSSGSDSFSEEGSFGKVIELGRDDFDDSKLRRFPQLNRIRARVLSFLHTTRVTLFLLLTLIARFALVCIVSIWKHKKFGFAKSALGPEAYWALIVETILGIILTIAMSLTIGLEISYMKTKFFSRVPRCLDFFFFLPLSILSAALSIQSWTQPEVRGALTTAHFAVFLPILFLLLSHRMYRSLGARNLLSTGGEHGKGCACQCGSKSPEVDFVWTTPKNNDDMWLREELSALADGTSLRLHRYVTREKEEDLEAAEDHIDASAGRPKWDLLFTEIAEKSPTGAEIGVFFCGPHVMGSAVQKSLREVEIRSNLRGSYLSSLSDAQLAEDYGASTPNEIRRLRRYGNNVRFVFREENF